MRWNALGVKAEKQLMPMQPGDVPSTAADTSALGAVGTSPIRRCGRVWLTLWPGMGDGGLDTVALFPDLNHCTVAVIGLGYVGLPLAVEFSKPQLSPHRYSAAAGDWL